MKNQREWFVLLARMPEANISELSRRFGISWPTAYKWLHRHDARAADRALGNRSTKPANSPRRSSLQLEDAVLALWAQQAAWGGC